MPRPPADIVPVRAFSELSTAGVAYAGGRGANLGEIRPIRPEDKQALIDSFGQFSEHSRYQRFLTPHDRLSADELRYFTEIDHHDHEALVDRSRLRCWRGRRALRAHH